MAGTEIRARILLIVELARVGLFMDGNAPLLRFTLKSCYYYAISVSCCCFGGRLYEGRAYKRLDFSQQNPQTRPSHAVRGE